MRKQTADMLRRMQTLVRLQARARASRAYVTKSLDSASKMLHSRNAVSRPLLLSMFRDGLISLFTYKHDLEGFALG